MIEIYCVNEEWYFQQKTKPLMWSGSQDVSHLCDTQQRLHDTCVLCNSQVDDGQQTVGQIGAPHAVGVSHGALTDLLKPRVLKHQLQLTAPLLVRHLLQALPHAREDAADVLLRRWEPLQHVQHIRGARAVLQMCVERSPFCFIWGLWRGSSSFNPNIKNIFSTLTVIPDRF